MTRVPFTQNHRWHLPLLLLVFCCSFFINNGAIFADIMESRNIITAREMVYDHNWLVPTMNGELRLEKSSPLPTWICHNRNDLARQPSFTTRHGRICCRHVSTLYKFANQANRQPNLCPGIFARLMYFV